MSEVVVLTMSEFGRTVRENGNRGTDHGHATAMLVLGGSVKGGGMVGPWPGLAREQLYEGRDLAVTTDFRHLFAEVAGSTSTCPRPLHFSPDFPRILPGIPGCSCRLPRMWEALALTAALCQVLRNTVMKRLGHELDEYMAVWGRFTFLLPFAALFVAWRGVPVIKPGFLWACLLFAVSQIISTMALSKALKLSSISMVTALWKVSLLVLVVLGYLTLKEKPNLLGIAGILISMIGVYLLNVQRAHISWWGASRRALHRSRPPLHLLAALFYAPSVVTIKWAMQLSDPFMGTLGGYLAASLLVTPWCSSPRESTSRPSRATGWPSCRSASLRRWAR
jgi:drug/metabolite transporter (DMT)-like permease